MAKNKKVLFFRPYSNVFSNEAFLMEKSSAEMLLFFCKDLCARCLKSLPFQFQNKAKGWAPYPLSLKYMYCFSSQRSFSLGTMITLHYFTSAVVPSKTKMAHLSFLLKTSILWLLHLLSHQSSCL